MVFSVFSTQKAKLNGIQIPSVCTSLASKSDSDSDSDSWKGNLSEVQDHAGLIMWMAKGVFNVSRFLADGDRDDELLGGKFRAKQRQAFGR